MNLYVLHGKKEHPKPSHLGFSLEDAVNVFTPSYINPYNYKTESKMVLEQVRKIKSDPLNTITDYVGNINDVIYLNPANVKDTSQKIYEFAKKYSMELIKDNFMDSIDSQVLEDGKQLTEYASILKTPQELMHSIALPVSTKVGTLSASISPYAPPIATTVSYSLVYDFVDDLYQKAMKKVLDHLFPKEKKQVKEKLKMVNLSDEYLRSLPMASWNTNTDKFEYLELPATELPKNIRDLIIADALRFEKLLSLSGDYVEPISKIADYIFWSLWANKSLNMPSYDPDDVYSFIAVVLFNVRANALQTIYDYAITHTGAGYASYMKMVEKDALAMVSVLGRWEAKAGENVWKEKMAQDRKIWAQKAGAGQAEFEAQKAQHNEKMAKYAKTGLISAGALALLSFLV